MWILMIFNLGGHEKRLLCGAHDPNTLKKYAYKKYNVFLNYNSKSRIYSGFLPKRKQKIHKPFNYMQAYKLVILD